MQMTGQQPALKWTVVYDISCYPEVNGVNALFRRWDWEVTEYPFYSPDMTPCDFYFFNINGEVAVEMERSVWQVNKMDTVNAIQHLPKIWERVAQMVGECIEEL